MEAVWKVNRSVRIVIALAAMATVLGFVAAVLGEVPGAGWALVVLPAMLSTMCWAASMRVPVAQTFSELSRAERKDGLQFAWAVPSVQVPGANQVLGGAYALAIPLALAPEVIAADAAVTLTLWVACLLWSCLVGGWYGYVACSRALRKEMLRTIAADWVRRWHVAWLRRAGEVAGAQAASRFRMDGAPTFSLSLPEQPAPPGMPPVSESLKVLVVGRYLGVRVGSNVDIRHTSFMQADDNPEVPIEPAVSDLAGCIEEREAHYRDIASVDYQRDERAPQRGRFLISISGAAPIAFETSEAGVGSAVEAVRRQTREAKLA